MDFEIEGDDDDYNFEWGESSKPAVKKNSMFGGDAGGYEDETEYNFSYENDRGSKKKYEPFSPVVAHQGNSVGKAAPKNAPVVNSGNALERAQSLMDKYSGKTVSAPTSNFRNQNIRTFSEADISMSSSEEEASEFEMSESIDDTPVGKKGGKKEVKGKPAGKRDINALDSKAHVVVSMGESMDDDDYLSEQDDTAAPPRSLKHAPKFDDVSEGSESAGDEESEGSEDSVGQEEDANEYSNEEFDQDAGESYEESAEEVGESTHLSGTVDTEPDLSNRYVSKVPVGVQYAVRNGSSTNFPATATATSAAADPTARTTATTIAANPSNVSASQYTTNSAQSVFNSTRRAASSPAYSDTSDSTRPVSPDPVEEEGGLEGRDRSELSDSPNENNASYSRLVYGNEDEHSSVSSDYSAMNATGGSRGSKPKVFSFADLLSQESFEGVVKDAAPAVAAVKAYSSSNLNSTNLNEVSDLQDEFTRPVLQHYPTANAGSVGTTSINTGDVNSNTATNNVNTTKSNTNANAHVPVSAPVVHAAYTSSTTATTTSTGHVQLPTRSDSPPTTTSSAKPAPNSAVNIVAHTAPAVPEYAYPPAAPNALPPHHTLPAQPTLPSQPPYPYPYPYPHPGLDANGQPLPQSHPQPSSQGLPQSPYPYPYPYPPPPPPSYYPYQQYYPPSPYPYPFPYPTPPQATFAPPAPPHPSADSRFSRDYNPLLHGASPTLHAPEALSNPHMRASHPYPLHGVSPRLSLSEANQVYGSAYFDRDVAQQPLVIDLLQELRKSKEEAAWAKNKLAETIVKLGQQQTQLLVAPSTTTNHNSITAGTGTTNASSSGGVGESKVATPERAKKHNAVSFLQDVISPVHPVRGSASSAASSAAGAKKRLDESDEIESDAESYAPDHEEEEDEEGYSDYSDDFEQENANNNGNSSPTKAKKSSSGNIGSGAGGGSGAHQTSYTANTNNTTPSPSTTTTSTTSTTAAHTHFTGPTLAQVKQAQDEASRGLRERERVMNPLKESLAYSLLASQELFKNQLESLRARIAATNDYTNLMQQRVNTQWDTINTGTVSGGSSSSGAGGASSSGAFGDLGDVPASLPFQPTPSLHHLRSSFESRRAASAEKLLDLLTQVYPNMTLEEATRLAAKI